MAEPLEARLAQQQSIAIAAAISGLMTAGEAGASLCCTIEARNAEGEDVSIQVMQDSVNITPYDDDSDPLERLDECGATDGLDAANLEVVDWEAGKYAAIGIEGLGVADVARLVDQVFTRLLGCDDASNAPSATTEDLG
jgi:hypothetical protein